MNDDQAPLRRLPWTGDDGRPCYLSTDGTGPLSRLADRIEAAQLALGNRLLLRARYALTGRRRAPATELRILATQLTDALSDAVLIAESRGERLAVAFEAAAPDATPWEDP